MRQETVFSFRNCVDKGADSYFDLVLKSLKDRIVSLENQLRDKQYIVEELSEKAI